MGLDSRYIPAFNLQKEIIDKNTGFSLAGGKVYFYKDTARTTLKKIYQISGTPPNYTYIELPNPITLNSIGTFQNTTGDDVIVYYYPYDADGKIELYYIEVESATADPQFTREGQPNISAEAETVDDVKNYIPNGQFLDHAVSSIAVNSEYTTIARGGWQFARSPTSTATDQIAFLYEPTWTEIPTSNPRFFLRIQCTSPHVGDTFKELRIVFDDVNKFSSDNQKYTFQFEAKSNSGSPVNIQAKLQKNFGTGGSPETFRTLESFTVSPGSWNIFATSFVFESNSGKNISDDNDDFMSLIINLPPESIFNISFSNFILTEGEVTIPNFPITTNQQTIYQSEFTKDFLDRTGNNLYLPIIQTREGLSFDHSIVGSIVAFSDRVESLHPNYLICNGQRVTTASFNSVGIPYSRLFYEIFHPYIKVPIWGTGSGYFTAFQESGHTQIILTNNNVGVATATADGATPTGFTFETVHSGVASGYEIKSYTYQGIGFYIVTDNFATENGNTSSPQGPFYYTPLTIGIVAPPPPGFGRDFEEFATNDTPLVDKLTAVAGSSITAGDYGVFIVDPGAAPTYASGPTHFGYWWYKKDGSGTDPALGLKYNIQINIRSTDSQHEIAEKTRMALNGWQVTRIVTTAASSITAGSYFTANSPSEGFYVWYKKDGAGTDPALSGKVGIEVSILGTDTAAVVADKTKTAINSRFYAVPDLRGQFLRGSAQGDHSVHDPDRLNRFSLVAGIYGDQSSSLEFSKNKTHLHRVYDNNPGGGFPNAVPAVQAYTLNFYLKMLEGDRGLETRPTNVGVYYFIHL
ncbi:MAG: hypothetical protein FK731_10530 [Asgard group archaeon]|nr:hypothetical protein [Asgard group archaeon]